MRWSTYKVHITDLAEIESSLDAIKYCRSYTNISEEYHFRNVPYHLIIRKKKTRLEFRLHRDRIYLGRHGRPAFDGKDVEQEKKKIVKVLEDKLLC